MFHLIYYADFDVPNEGSRTGADAKNNLQVKHLFLFSIRITLFDIHQFLIRYLAYYSVLSREF